MSDTVSPPVRVLDYGYQSPNPLDYQRAGVALMEPQLRVASEANAAQNQFLLNHINNQRMMEMAVAQHKMQIERENLRDERMVKVAKMRSDAQIEYLKEKGFLDDVKAKSTYLQNRLGGDPITRQQGETDANYSTRLDSAIKDKLQGNIQSDTKAAYGIRKQMDAYTSWLNDPRVNQAVSGEVQQATQNPGVQAQAQNFVSTNFNRWMESLPEAKSTMIQQALDKAGPANRDRVLSVVPEYQSFVGSATQQAAYSYLKAAGSPAGKQFAAANENLKLLGQQLQNISMMPGDNGRMVPKSWWSQVQNGVGDLYLHDKQMEQPAASPAAAPLTVVGAVPPGARQINPTVAPTPGFMSRATSGLSAFLPSNTPDFGVSAVPVPATDTIAARAQQIQSSGMFVPPDMNGRGGMAVPGAIPFFPGWGGSSAVGGGGNPGIVAPPVAAPQPGPTANTFMMPAMPNMQPVPAGASISPGAGITLPPSVTGAMDTSNPYDDAMNMMRMRAMYAQ